MNLTRRDLLKQTASLGLAAAITPLASSLHAANAAGRRLRVAVVGLGRGMSHIATLVKIPDVEIAYLADVDSKRLERGMKTVSEKQQAPCQGIRDFRKALEDKSLDAVFIATPNFWHTPAALLSMQAGKHVYVEKPGSQNPYESELIVEGARKYGKHVQMGNQRRSLMRDAIAALHAGAIGELHFARSFYNASRKALGLGVPSQERSADLDFNLWQGPVAEDRDIREFVHYEWHWLWNWGNGELGNNGVHTLDVLRWGLQVTHPHSVTYTGGRYWHNDKQETPDTGSACYNFGKVGMEWVQSSCSPRAAEKTAGECVFYGEGGTFAISGPAWTVYDSKGVKTSEGKGSEGADILHIGNFIETLRSNATLNSPIHEGQLSTILCHLGHIAYRTGTVIHCDPQTGKIINNPEGEKLWRRSYRKGWEPSL
jgi:predicted dehydrogenase